MEIILNKKYIKVLYIYIIHVAIMQGNFVAGVGVV